MLYQLLLGMTSVLWGGLWGYSTLLVILVFMKETESFYAFPMRAALDRFVETLGFGWLKPLHDLGLTHLRLVSYALFGSITLGVGLVAFYLD